MMAVNFVDDCFPQQRLYSLIHFSFCAPKRVAWPLNAIHFGVCSMSFYSVHKQRMGKQMERSENGIDIANAMCMKIGYASMALFHRIRLPFNACVLLMAFLCIMFMELSCSVNLFLSFIESTDTFDTYQTVVITQQCL